MIDAIRQKMSLCPSEEDRLYLLESIDEKCGFFALNGLLIFMVSSSLDKKVDMLKTEKLLLNTNVEVLNVANDSTFKAGKYDYILFNGASEETDFESFVKICTLYASEKEKISIKDFFFSILDMFQLPKEQQFKNLIGLIGELTVIMEIYDKKGISVASGWHESSTDKYDINYQNTVIEVKTTTSDLYTVKVKHDQLFGREGVVLATVRVIESNAGDTLERLIAKINSIDIFAKDFSFQLKLGKELKRISPKEYKTKNVEVKGVRFYKNSDIATIRDIPDNITGIEYNCTLLETKETRIEELIFG